MGDFTHKKPPELADPRGGLDESLQSELVSKVFKLISAD